MSRTLWLHIGHGKTGSSYLQSVLALNREALIGRGVDYPAPRDIAAARMGETTVGNASRFRRQLGGAWSSRLAGVRHSFGRGDVLLSNEGLLNALAYEVSRRNLMRFAAVAGFDRIRALLFIRDPDEHFLSFYGQVVKYRGETRDIDDMLSRYPPPRNVNAFLKAMRDEPDVDVTVRNYSRVRGALKAELADWLGLSVNALADPPVSAVNRSLTAEEIAVQRALNHRFGPCPALYADRIGRAPPMSPATKLALTAPQRDRLRDDLQVTMRRVNKWLPEEDHYRFQMAVAATPFDLGQSAFSPAQRAAFEDAAARADTKRSPGLRRR